MSDQVIYQSREFAATFLYGGMGSLVFRAAALARLFPRLPIPLLPIIPTPPPCFPSTLFVSHSTPIIPILTTIHAFPVNNALAPAANAPFEAPHHPAGGHYIPYQYNPVQHAQDLERLTQQETANQELLEELDRLSNDNKRLRRRNGDQANSLEVLDIRITHVENFNDDLRHENMRLTRFVDSIAYVVDATRQTGQVPANVAHRFRRLPAPHYDAPSEDMDDYEEDEPVYLGTRLACRTHQSPLERCVFGTSSGSFDSNAIIQDEADLPEASEGEIVEAAVDGAVIQAVGAAVAQAMDLGEAVIGPAEY